MDKTNEASIQQSVPLQGQSATPKAKFPIILLGILVLVIIGMGVYFLKNNSSNKMNTPTFNQTKQALSQSVISIPFPNKVTDTERTAVLKQILDKLEKDLNVTAPINESRFVEWLNQDKNRVPLTGQRFNVGTFANDYMGKYGNFSPNSDIKESDLHLLQPAIDKFFTSNEFQKDNQNTFRKDENDQLTLSMGYIKGDVKCLITFYAQIDPFGNFFCGIIDQQQVAWRKELFPVINTTNSPDIVVHVGKISGNFARGGVGYINDGIRKPWFAAKIDGTWKKVLIEQGLITCDELVKNNIPQEYWVDCFDKPGHIRKGNPGWNF